MALSRQTPLRMDMLITAKLVLVWEKNIGVYAEQQTYRPQATYRKFSKDYAKEERECASMGSQSAISKDEQFYYPTDEKGKPYHIHSPTI